MTNFELASDNNVVYFHNGSLRELIEKVKAEPSFLHIVRSYPMSTKDLKRYVTEGLTIPHQVRNPSMVYLDGGCGNIYFGCYNNRKSGGLFSFLRRLL